ncbi:hypothetical protein ACHAXS_011185 [Conticribra weissflogii]
MSNVELESKRCFRGLNIGIPFVDLQKPSQPRSDNNNERSQLEKGVPSLIKKLEFKSFFSRFQVLHIRGFNGDIIDASAFSTGDTSFHAGDVKSLFESLNSKDKDTWCIENNARNDDQGGASPEEFLDAGDYKHRGYCSFLVQHSKDVMKDLLENRLPVVDLPVEKDDCVREDGEYNQEHGTSHSSDQCKKRQDVMKVHYGTCLWFFFGKNKVNDYNSTNVDSTIQGRPEHTDSVTHDGTWHYQLSGTKIWKLRPTTELMNLIKEFYQKDNEDDNSMDFRALAKKRKLDTEENRPEDSGTRENGNGDNDVIEVECKQGDIIVLNTRLWWHSTMIPPQDVPCISYARDIYFPSSDVENDATKKGGEIYHKTYIHEQSASMSNVDGMYAAEDIEASTILFTEHTMPDCELHRSKSDPNCHVVELQDESTGEVYMAVVSLRDIKAGEFFCILESDEEDGDFEEDEDAVEGCEDDVDGLHAEVEDDESEEGEGEDEEE